MTITERDQFGRIVKKELSSERAAEIGSLGGKAPRRTTEAKIQEMADQLLIEAGYDPPDSAPLKMQIAARQSAAGKMDALKFYDAKTSPQAPSGEAVVIDNHNYCCIWDLPMDLAFLVRRYLASSEKEQELWRLEFVQSVPREPEHQTRFDAAIAALRAELGIEGASK